MPERTIEKFVYFTTEDGTVHSRGATVDLSKEDAKRYDELGTEAQADSQLDGVGTTGPSQEGNPEGPPPDPSEGEQAENAYASIEELEEKGESDGWASLTTEQLQDVADARGLDPQGSGSGGGILKRDLIAALESDDRAPAREGDSS